MLCFHSDGMLRLGSAGRLEGGLAVQADGGRAEDSGWVSSQGTQAALGRAPGSPGLPKSAAGESRAPGTPCAPL